MWTLSDYAPLTQHKRLFFIEHFPQLGGIKSTIIIQINQKGEQVMIYRKLFRMLTAGLFVLAVSIPAMASDQNAPIEKEILALDMSWGQAAAKADGTVLGKLLADDLYHVHADRKSVV